MSEDHCAIHRAPYDRERPENSMSTPTELLTGAPLAYNFPCVTAAPIPHALPRYAANDLIGALRFPRNTASLRRALTYVPDFTEDMRRLDRSTRRLQLEEMKRLRIGLPRLCELAELVSGGMLESYVGRVPHTPESIRRLNELYRHRGHDTVPRLPENGAEFAGSLIGMGGCGKTFALDAVAALFADTPVIHHPELGVWQIPIVKLAMPILGTSRRTLGNAIIHELDKLFPEGDYARLYLKPRFNSNQLLLIAFSLLQIHLVGYVLIDDSAISTTLEDGVSKKEAAEAKRTPMTTLLIAMSNQSRVPMLFSGTPETRRLLGTTWSLLRRSTGTTWGPLSIQSRGTSRSEFDVVFGILWTLQLLRQPVEYSERMRQLFYLLSGGIPDNLVKLFTRVQKRALFEERESFTEELVLHVATTEMRDAAEVAVAYHHRDEPGALERLLRLSDIQAELEPNGAPKGEFGRPRPQVWTLETALEQYFDASNEEGFDSEVGRSATSPLEPPAPQTDAAACAERSAPAVETTDGPIQPGVSRPKPTKLARKSKKLASLVAKAESASREKSWTEVGR